MLCHPAGTNFEWALVSLAKLRFPDEEVDLVHRIDRDTSGLVVLTRNRAANRELKEVMKAGGFHKEYEAIVKGCVPWEEREIDLPIGPAGGEIRIQMAARPDGQPAMTMVEVVGRGRENTLVRCVLRTGRTHQIRVHLATVGFPILGDRLYGVAPEIFLRSLEGAPESEVAEHTGAERQALHHRRVRFMRPSNQETIEVEAPLPNDLQRLWSELKSE